MHDCEKNRPNNDRLTVKDVEKSSNEEKVRRISPWLVTYLPTPSPYPPSCHPLFFLTFGRVFLIHSTTHHYKPPRPRKQNPVLSTFSNASSGQAFLLLHPFPSPLLLETTHDQPSAPFPSSFLQIPLLKAPAHYIRVALCSKRDHAMPDLPIFTDPRRMWGEVGGQTRQADRSW
ncbi:uncharacterized protein BKA78DRAFT_144813 [Phyllosticta capitalensis]|uniref:uncharacterized protein n=1 Tax=Phyllosticta capitalensis TaxID=121624 RepID=UPI00312E0F14